VTSALSVCSSVAILLLIALIWALRAPRRLSRGNFDLNSLEQPGRRHATYLSLVRHAASSEDLAFLAKRGYGKLRSRLHLERRKVVLLYLRPSSFFVPFIFPRLCPFQTTTEYPHSHI